MRQYPESYCNQDVYTAADDASSRADVGTHESLMAKDLDNKLPIKLTPRQMGDLVEFVKARLIFYDKKNTSWLNRNKRLFILKEWTDAVGHNGTILQSRFPQITFWVF